jgi:AcrR family transcriptional regulator
VARDTELTRQKLKAAAAEQFAAVGLHGTTVDRIAQQAGVNKERLYAYFGGKRQLFSVVLAEELSKLAAAVPLKSLSSKNIGEFAGKTYDYHLAHPDLTRLLLWEGLTFGEEAIPDEEARARYYSAKIRAFAAAQDDGAFDTHLEASHLLFFIIALAAWWAAVPQMARVIDGIASMKVTARDRKRRRASVVRAAMRLAVSPEDWNL